MFNPVLLRFEEKRIHLDTIIEAAAD